MKIAITADIHLTSRERHPERFHALENILDQLVDQEIKTLIIAGDLFDASCTTPGLFEDVVKKKKYANIEIYIIPGNHDPVLSQGTFSHPNIKYITTPQLITFNKTIPFVFIPYTNASSIGETLSGNQFKLEMGKWVLISHGDWLAGMGNKNQYEKGTYMPLSGREIQLYKPKKVFLGHIHAKTDSSVVHYPGSPCAIDPTETGYRSFLILDSNTLQVSRNGVEADYLFFNEQFTVLPLDEEATYVKTLLSERIKAWNIPSADQSKVRVRIKARGFSRDRHELDKVIRGLIKDYQFADNDQPDISQVKISNDQTQGMIAELVKEKIDLIKWDSKTDEPDKDDLLLVAMNMIYGGK